MLLYHDWVQGLTEVWDSMLQCNKVTLQDCGDIFEVPAGFKKRRVSYAQYYLYMCWYSFPCYVLSTMLYLPRIVCVRPRRPKILRKGAYGIYLIHWEYIAELARRHVMILNIVYGTLSNVLRWLLNFSLLILWFFIQLKGGLYLTFAWSLGFLHEESQTSQLTYGARWGG